MRRTFQESPWARSTDLCSRGVMRDSCVARSSESLSLRERSDTFVSENSAPGKCGRAERGREERARITASLGSGDWPWRLVRTAHRTEAALGWRQGREAAWAPHGPETGLEAGTREDRRQAH